ncbi:hypothetical protein O9992_16400 [Vibrio lentus]|nr:hypothetical protein [Vibrio lentus]
MRFYSIHPGDSYSFVATNTVNDKASAGEITNVVKVVGDARIHRRRDFTFQKMRRLEITKEVTSSTFREIRQYTVTVKNNGLGWAADVVGR